jgi:hypothetical protein
MKLSLFGRISMALFASLALGLGMTACGGGTIGYMWVLGQQYNQIAGFKIDDYSGNLTATAYSPYASNGSVPVSIVVKPGGRYVYVLNQGVGGGPSGSGSGAGISVFSVGGDGVLAFQQSYSSEGFVPQWMQLDTTGAYLYVLDKYSPAYDSSNGKYDKPNTDGNGSITAFSIDATTGRLTVVTNAAVLQNGVAIPFFEVGPSPFMMKTASSCLFTMNSGNQTVTPYALSSAGQLVIQSPGQYVTGAVSATSITSGGAYVFITDSNNGSGTGNVQFYTVGSNCNLHRLLWNLEPLVGLRRQHRQISVRAQQEHHKHPDHHPLQLDLRLQLHQRNEPGTADRRRSVLRRLRSGVHAGRSHQPVHVHLQSQRRHDHGQVLRPQSRHTL